MDAGSGRVADAIGLSQAEPQSAQGLDPTGFDPSRGCLLWSDDLTDKQLAMVMACKGDGSQLGDSVGLELRGSDFTIARALVRKGLGTIDGEGGFLPPLFWLNEEGVRIAHEFDDDLDDDHDFDAGPDW